MAQYQVIVGNIGTVYDGTSRKVAVNTYDEYVKQSTRGIGRAAGESVLLMADGEPEQEHVGTVQE